MQKIQWSGMRMIFKSIVLENFRPYYGRVNFEFCSGYKNITLLKAENGSGKTTLLEAIKWGLYGEALNLTAGDPKDFGASSFVNKKYLSETKGRVAAKVMLKIVGKVSEEASEEEYTIVREIVFENDIVIGRNLSLKTKIGEINSKISGQDPQEIIDKLLPKEIDFFVDGERLEKIAPEKDNIRKIKNESVEVLKESINRVLGIKSLENAVNDLARIHKEFEKEYLESMIGKEEKLGNLIQGGVEELETAAGLTQEEVDECRKSVHQFIEENRQEGRAVTASKLATALSRWKSNALVKMGIINFLK